MEEAGAVLQTMEGGARLGLDVTKDVLELIFRFINFIIERYERSKEFKMKYSELNEEQIKRRSGYLTAKQMKEEMERTGQGCIPVSFSKELSPAEEEKFDRYANTMGFSYMVMEERALDKQGRPISDENGKPKMKRTYFVLESNLDKVVMILEILNRDKQHEDIEKSGLSEEQKEQMHKDVDMEAAYEENEQTVQNMSQDKTEFYEAMKQACETGDYSKLETLIKNENIHFYSSNEGKDSFTAVMNKNARRDYAKGQSYFVVDAKNPKRYIELISERNESQNRTDTTYKVYQNDELVFETNDKISDKVAEEMNGWNPEWNNIRESIAKAGGFEEDNHYFVFSSKEEFDSYREMFDKNIEQYTINPADISIGMDYAKAKEDIISQMKTNDFYNANVARGDENYQLSVQDAENIRFSADQMGSLETIEKIDYQIFQNNMEQYATINRLEEISSNIRNKQNELQQINLDDPIAAMENNGKINKEIEGLKKEHDIYATYLAKLCENEKVLLSSYAEEIAEEKAKNRDAHNLLNSYRANKALKETGLDISDFSKEQKAEIKQGLAHGLNEAQVKSYMDKSMSPEQMKLQRTGLESGLKNTQIEHLQEIYNKTLDFELSADVITAYKTGLSKEQVDFVADNSLNSEVRGQFIEACRENVHMDVLGIVKEDAIKNNLLTVRTSALLQVATIDGISPDAMTKICGIKNEEAIKEVKKALDKGLSIKELEPVLKADVTPQQVQGVANILFAEKRENSREKQEKTPSKEQFKKAQEWAQRQNSKADKSKDLSKETTRSGHSNNVR